MWYIKFYKVKKKFYKVILKAPCKMKERLKRLLLVMTDFMKHSRATLSGQKTDVSAMVWGTLDVEIIHTRKFARETNFPKHQINTQPRKYSCFQFTHGNRQQKILRHVKEKSTRQRVEILNEGEKN